MREVIAFVECGFAFVAGEGVGVTVAEVEVGGAAAASAVVAVSLAGYFGLRDGDWLDPDSRICEYLFEFGREDRISVSIHNNVRPSDISHRRDCQIPDSRCRMP